MRQQGRISDWKDDRGFGFITPQGGGTPIFVHVSAFDRSQVRPLLNAEVTYDIQVDPKKGPRAVNVSYVGGDKIVSRQPSRTAQQPHRPRHIKPKDDLRRTWRNTVLTVAVALGLGAYAWQQFQARTTPIEDAQFSVDEPAYDSPTSETAEPESRFACEGKQHCSEMRSCEEAQFYVANCPDTKMDSDDDGLACEDRCGHW